MPLNKDPALVPLNLLNPTTKQSNDILKTTNQWHLGNKFAASYKSFRPGTVNPDTRTAQTTVHV